MATARKQPERREGDKGTGRKPRMDKGQPRATERDIWLLTWIAEQYAVRFDQLWKLIDTRPLGKTVEEDEVQATTVRYWLARWRRAGIVDYRVIIANQWGWVWLTRKGLEMVKPEYRMWVPNLGRMRHLYFCNEVRMIVEDRDDQPIWRSERTLRQEQGERKKGERAKHLPDAEIAFNDSGQVIAVEVELWPKKELGRLGDILVDLAEHYGYHGQIWYWALPGAKKHVEEVLKNLRQYPITDALKERFSFAELKDTWEK